MSAYRRYRFRNPSVRSSGSRRRSFVRTVAVALVVLSLAVLPAVGQTPDEAALRQARKLRAEAAYLELKGKPEEAAKLYEQSLQQVPDEKIAAKVETLRGGGTVPVAEPGAKPAETAPAETTPGGAGVLPAPVAPPLETVGATPAIPGPTDTTAVPAPSTVRRKVNDQCEEMVDIAVEVEGLGAAIPAGSPDEAYFASFLPSTAAIKARENGKFGNEYQEWSDEGPYVHRTGVASAGTPVILRVTSPEKPAMKPDGEGVETVVTQRTFSFVVYDSSEAGKTKVDPQEDSEQGTFTWTPTLHGSSGVVCGPTVVGVYVEYRTDRRFQGESMGALAGGRHRIGWVVVANPGMPICVENRLFTVTGDGQPAVPRKGWTLPEPPAVAEPRILVAMDQKAMRKADLQISQDFRRLALVEGEEGAEFVVVDGSRSPCYHDVTSMRFCNEGRNFWFVGKVGRWEVPVINGMEGPAFARIVDLSFSRDGNHHAFVGADGYGDGQSRVILDGKTLGAYDNGEIEKLVVSPDGARVAWILKDDEGRRVILDGAPGPVFNTIPGYRLQFSPARNRLCYTATQEDKDVVVLEGALLNVPCSTKDPVFSPDGAHLAYVGTVEGGEAVVLDGVAGKVHPGIWDEPVFSPDGTRLAYVVSDNAADQAWAVVDGVEGTPRACNRWAVSSPVFSADSKRVAYCVDTAENQSVLVVDGKEAATGTDIRRVGFSPDGKRVAWFDTKGKETCAVVDGVAGPAYSDLYTDDPVLFSPDSAHFFTFARIDDKVNLFADHKEFVVAEVIAPVLLFDVPGKVCLTTYGDGKLELVEVPLP